MFYSILYVLPKNFISWLFGVIAATPFPFFIREPVIYFFAKFYKIDLYEAEKDFRAYRSLNEFFTRKLKVGTRPIQGGVVHPADAHITQAGPILEGTLIQAKGKDYFLRDFLGESAWLYDRYHNGYFATYYLCPTDYHRVHAPVDGYIIETNYIPGNLWPVNNWSVQNIPELFAVNERVVMTLETSQGFCSVVMVGATNVGKMTLSFDKDICTNSFWNRKPVRKKYEKPIAIQKGDEMGVFNMGSTVVMIYEKNFFKNPKFPMPVGSEPVKVRLGNTLE